jgi:translation elongation factor P/translation initiation factor 5A
VQLNALDLRKGYLVDYQGRMCTVSDWSIMRNDRRQYVFVTLKDLLTGRVSELKEHGDTKFEVLDKDSVELSHSYQDGLEEVFYDKEGVEFRCPAAAAKDALMWGSDSYVGFLVNGKLITVSPPSSVVVKVADCAPPMKGSNNSWKDAVLENGVKLKVANLVNAGDRVRVDPFTLEFRERVTS